MIINSYGFLPYDYYYYAPWSRADGLTVHYEITG